jgi:hypothetical protein
VGKAWDIEEHDQSCFIVRDNNGMAIAYVYFETDAGRRAAANLLTRDEVRRIAALPGAIGPAVVLSDCIPNGQR